MEGVPRLPMVYVELKENSIDITGMEWSGITVEILEKQQQMIRDEIEKQIKESFGDDPAKHKSSIDALIELQDSAYKVLLSPDFDGCNILKKYFGQMHYMKTRFPFTGDNALDVSFSWNDAFTGNPNTKTTFEFEQAAILFNIGAIHSYLGAVDSRKSEEGIRMSCVHFQSSAGMFQYLLDHFDTTLSADMSSGVLKFYISLNMAQAQECLLEKSMQDNRKSIIVAKVSQQVVDNYKQVQRTLSSCDGEETLGSSVFKAWKKLFAMKVVYYAAFTHYFLGNDSIEQEKYGQSVAYFHAAVDKFTEASKLAKSLQKKEKEPVLNALKFASDVFNGKYNSALKDNNFVYHEKVPDMSVLPEVKGAALVKALPYKPDDVNVTGPDIFAKLVPMETHLAASTYSDDKDKLRRRIDEMIDEKNEVLRAYKESLNLNANNIIRIEDAVQLDATLIENSAALSVDKSPMAKLQAAMESLTEMYDNVDVALNNVLDLTEMEETDDTKIRSVCGDENAVSIDNVEEIKQELSKYIEGHQETKQHKESLQTAIRIYLNNLKLVASGLDAIRDEIKMVPTSRLLDDEDKAVVGKMQLLFSKVSEMEEQRSSFQTKLKENLEADDVTSSLVMKHGVDQQELFKEELKKHDDLVDIIEKNLSAQDNILDAITETNALYIGVKKKVNTEKNRVAEKVQTLVQACTMYEDVIKKTEEGKTFFQEQLSDAEALHKKMEEVRLKNTRERKKQLDLYRAKEKAKKPPARPSAPKPKLEKKSPKIPSAAPAPAHVLTPDEIAAMAMEDEDFNDPEFLAFLKASGEGDFDPSIVGMANPAGKPPVSALPANFNPARRSSADIPPIANPALRSYRGAMSQRGYSPVNSMHPSYSPQMQSPSHQIYRYPQHRRGSMPSHLPPTSPVHMSVVSGYSNMSPVHHSNRSTPEIHPQSFVNMPPNSYQPGLPSHISQEPFPHTVNTVHGLISSPHRGYNPVSIAPVSLQQPTMQMVQTIPHNGMQTYSPQSYSQQSMPPTSYPHSQASFQPQINRSQNTIRYNPNVATSNIPNPPPIQVSQVAVVYMPPTQHYSNARQQVSDSQMSFHNLASPSFIPRSEMQNPHSVKQMAYAGQPGIQYQPQQPVVSSRQQISHQPANPRQQFSQINNFQNPQQSAYQPAVSNQQTPQPMQQHSQAMQPLLTQQLPAQTIQGPQQNFPSSAQQQPNSSQQLGMQQQVQMPFQQMQNSPQHQAPLPQQSTANYQQYSQVPFGQYPGPQIQQGLQQPGQPVQRSGQQLQQVGQHVIQPVLMPAQQMQQPKQQNPQLGQLMQPGQQMQQPTGQQMQSGQYMQQHGQQTQQLGQQVEQPHQQLQQPGQQVQQPVHQSQQPTHQLQQSVPQQTIGNNQPRTLMAQQNFPQQNQIQTQQQQQSHVHNTPNADSKTSQPQTANLQPARQINQPPGYQASLQNVLTPVQTHSVTPEPPKPMAPKPSSDLADIVLPAGRASLSSESADMLLSSTESKGKVQQHNVLVPTKVIEEDQSALVLPIEGSAYMDEAELMTLKLEVEKMQKTVAELLIKPSNGTLSEMDKHWKYLSDQQEKHARQMTTAIARCSSYKNRAQDIVPFDQSRIVLKGGKDDYINASLIDSLTPYCPKIIATQSPIPQTISDFWLMVHEQNVCVIVMLVKESEIPKKCPMYWPTDRSQPHTHGPITVSFTSSKTHRNGLYTERRFTVKHKKQSLATSVTQLQFNSWPDQGLLSSIGDLLSFMKVVVDFHSQQRNIQWPVVVHCHSGVGHTAAFTAILAGVQMLEAGRGIPDVIQIVQKMRQRRKYMLQDKAQLKLTFDAMLYHAIDILKQRGVEVQEEIKTPVVQRSSSRGSDTNGRFDIFSGKGELSSIQATVEKFTIKPESKKIKKNDEVDSTKPEVPPTKEPTKPIENNMSNLIISDLVKGTMPSVDAIPQIPTQQNVVLENPKPDIIKNLEQIVRAEQNIEFEKPQLPQSQVTISTTNLIDSLSPDKFSLETTQEEKNKKAKKTTRADFFKLNSGLSSTFDPNDPFGGLDPLWGHKKKK